MRMIALIRADFLKQRHTSYWGIHTAIPIVGAILFVFYFLLYQKVDEVKKLRLLLELTAMVFPLLISIIVGLNSTLEEKASHFQSLLAVPNRRKMLLAKFISLYISGIFSLALLFMLFAIGVGIAGTGMFPWGLLIQSVLGLAIGSFIIYALHLFLSLKFGLGISLFLGVFECLQCILYSNIELRDLWRYIPFSWSVNWVHDVLYGRLAANTTQWILIVALSVGILLAILCWFSRWEGRKNNE